MGVPARHHLVPDLPQVFAVDFASPLDTLPLVGSAQAPERFNRLAWGPKSIADASAHPVSGAAL